MSLFLSTLKRSEIATEDFLTALDSLRETHNEIVDLARETMNDLDTFNRLVETQAVVSSESFDVEAVVNILNHGRALESLCGKSLAEINRVTALKALEDAAQAQSNTFLDKIKAFFQKILEWLRNLFTTVGRACKIVDAGVSLKKTETASKIISYDLFKAYPEIVAAIDKALDELDHESDEDRVKYDQNFKAAEEEARRLHEEWKKHVSGFGDAYKARRAGHSDGFFSGFEERRKASSELFEKMCAADERLSKMRTEGNGLLSVTDKLKRLVQNYPKYLTIDENNTLGVTEDAAPRVYEGTTHGYDTLEKIKEVAKIYESNKDKWYHGADSLCSRVGIRMAAWMMSKQTINTSPFLSEKDVDDFKKMIDSEIAQLRGIVFIQQFQNKMKAYMGSTLVILASQFVSGKAGTDPTEPQA